MRTAIRRAILLAAALGGALPVMAASLRTQDGGSVSVLPSPHLVVVGGLLPGTGATRAGGLGFDVVDGAGRRVTGMVPGTEDILGSAPIALGQSPVTRDVFLVFGRRAAAGTRLMFSAWTGQWWSEPELLFDATATVLSPALGFSEAGDAILTWVQDGAAPTVLVRHFEMSPAGVERQYAYQEVGDPTAFLRQVAADVRLRDGVAHVVGDVSSGRAFVFLADSAADQVGLLALDISRFADGTGIGAAPVPVILGRELATQSTGTAGSTPGLPSVGAKVGGFVVDPFRLEIEGREVYYWLDDDAVRGVVFKGEEAGRLLVLRRPDTDAAAHFAMYQAVRRELLGGERVAPSILRQGRARLGERLSR
jgi:hypothetical protein